MGKENTGRDDYRLETKISGLTEAEAIKLVDEFAKVKNQVAPDSQATGRVIAGSWRGKIRYLKRAIMEDGLFVYWKIILVFVICWLPYVIMTYPGNMAGDAGTGLLDLTGVGSHPYNVNNPFFQNVLMTAFYLLGKLMGVPDTGIFLYCFTQISLEVLLLSKVVLDLSRKSKIAACVLMLFFCAVPQFPLYAFQMGKDSNFGLAVMLFVAYALEAIGKDEFWKNRKKVFLFSLSIVLMGVFRNSGGWVPAIAFVLYACFAVRERKIVLWSVGVLAAVALSAYLPPVFGVPKTQMRENMSMPLQTMAYYAIKHPEDMTEEDKEIISKVIKYDRMLKRYDRNIVDNIKNNTTFNEKTTGPFLRLWFRKLMTNPLTMLEGFYRSTDKYLVPTEMCTIKPHIIVGYWVSDHFCELMNLRNNNPHLKKMSKFVKWWIKTPGFELFVKIGLYSIMLLMTTILCIVFKKGRYFFCLAPVLMVFIGCLLSPVNGYHRYAYSMIASTPIVLADLISSFFMKKRKTEGQKI